MPTLQEGGKDAVGKHDATGSELPTTVATLQQPLYLQIGGVRLFLSLPSVFLAAGLVTLRTLHLRLGGRWEFPWAIGVGLVSAQLAAGLHYWPLTALQSGLILLGPLYALTALAYSIRQDIPLRSAFAEPAIILGGLWIAAVFLR